MSAGTLKTGAWRGVVVVRHFVALRDESDALVGSRARKFADSGAGLRSRGSKALRQCRPQPVKVKGADSQARVSQPGSFGNVKTSASKGRQHKVVAVNLPCV